MITHRKKSTNSRSRSGSAGYGRFPARLFTMLEKIDTEGMSGIISWDGSGKRVIVKNRQALEKSGLLQKYMLQNKYSSFNRQLQYYGFKRVDDTTRTSTRTTKKLPTVPIFMHPCLQRNRPDLYKAMVTLRPSPSKNKTCPSPTRKAIKKRKTEEGSTPVNSEEVKKPMAKKDESSKLSRERKRNPKKSLKPNFCVTPEATVTEYFDEVELDFGLDKDYPEDDINFKPTHNFKENYAILSNKNYTSEYSFPSEVGAEQERQEGAHLFHFVEPTYQSKHEEENENSYNFLYQTPLLCENIQEDLDCMVVENDDVHAIVNTFEIIDKPLPINPINEVPQDDAGWAELKNMIVGV